MDRARRRDRRGGLGAGRRRAPVGLPVRRPAPRARRRAGAARAPRDPRAVFAAAQAVTGVVLGAYLQSSSLSALGGLAAGVSSAPPRSVVSLAAGRRARARRPRSTRRPRRSAWWRAARRGSSAMARELGGDDRLVAFMQYLRVLVVVLLTPLLVAVAFPGHHGGAAPRRRRPAVRHRRRLADHARARAARRAAGAGACACPPRRCSGPMILAARDARGARRHVRGARRCCARPRSRDRPAGRAALHGATVRQVGRLLVPVLLASSACSWPASAWPSCSTATTSVSLLDAYLATTPGGLYAVLAVAFGAGANTTFIVAVQGLRCS